MLDLNTATPADVLQAWDAGEAVTFCQMLTTPDDPDLLSFAKDEEAIIQWYGMQFIRELVAGTLNLSSDSADLEFNESFRKSQTLLEMYQWGAPPDTTVAALNIAYLFFYKGYGFSVAMIDEGRVITGTKAAAKAALARRQMEVANDFPELFNAQVEGKRTLN